MSEVRLAHKGEVGQQKEIWKLCFGDSDQYIDFYYDHRYREDETMLLLEKGEIAAMLTMLPVKVAVPDKRSFDSNMFYAIATHPLFQNRGYAAQLMAFASQYLRKKKKVFSVLVPAGKELFGFYQRQGYQEGFYNREILFTRKMIKKLSSAETGCCAMAGISPAEYNQRRNEQLCGRLYVSYAEEEIAYQKKLSQHFSADIYGLEIEGVQGCAAVERLGSDKVFIKELLIPEKYIPAVVRYISASIPAKEYVLRTSPFSGRQSDGAIRPFGMIRANNGIDLKITPEDAGYLGLAFD